MKARTILALSVPVAFVGFVVIAINSERLSEAGLAAVSAILVAIVDGTYNNTQRPRHRSKVSGNFFAAICPQRFRPLEPG